MQSKLPCCASQLCCVLLLPVSDRQYGGNLRGGKTGGRERSNTCRKRKKRKSSTPYTIIRNIPGTALFSKESTQRSDTAPQRRARHRTARRYAALLGYV